MSSNCLWLGIGEGWYIVAVTYSNTDIVVLCMVADSLLVSQLAVCVVFEPVVGIGCMVVVKIGYCWFWLCDWPCAVICRIVDEQMILD